MLVLSYYSFFLAQERLQDIKNNNPQVRQMFADMEAQHKAILEATESGKDKQNKSHS